jgi:heptosyltransferase-2/heptosyltransferase-3
MWAANPSLDALEVVGFPGITSRSLTRPWAPYLLLQKVAQRRSLREIDLAVLLRSDYWWGAALLWAAGIPRRWGYGNPGTSAWLTDTIPYVHGRHEVEQSLRLVEAMVAGARAGKVHPVRINKEEGVPALRPPAPVPCEGVPGDWLNAPRRAVIHPGTGAANKLWTVGGWAEVADRLAGNGWAVVLTGSPDEGPLAGLIEWVTESKPPNLAGKTANLGELAWVLGQAEMVLGVDSGPLHIAAALGKPSLHLYGPSDENIWGPWGDPKIHRALRAPGTRATMFLDVLSKEIEGGPEMRAITVEMVMGEIEKLAGVVGEAG